MRIRRWSTYWARSSSKTSTLSSKIIMTPPTTASSTKRPSACPGRSFWKGRGSSSSSIRWAVSRLPSSSRILEAITSNKATKNNYWMTKKSKKEAFLWTRFLKWMKTRDCNRRFRRTGWTHSTNIRMRRKRKGKSNNRDNPKCRWMRGSSTSPSTL